ncbi:MAG: peptidase M52 [Hyphomicrobiales bacterium]|nr:MAG: peptidase M52 [Hyphomicrobiales bacterium]
MPCGKTILVLGLGNRLLSDDAAGPLVIDRLSCSEQIGADVGVVLRDGGTMGLSLLPEIEDCDGFIAVDAASFGAEPGTVRVFEGADVDALLGGTKKTAHEVALGDLLGAAALNGAQPVYRALVAVQPVTTELGLEPTPAVAAAVPAMAEEVETVIRRWRAGAQAAEPNPRERETEVAS